MPSLCYQLEHPQGEVLVSLAECNPSASNCEFGELEFRVHRDITGVQCKRIGLVASTTMDVVHIYNAGAWLRPTQLAQVAAVIEFRELRFPHLRPLLYRGG